MSYITKTLHILHKVVYTPLQQGLKSVDCGFGIGTVTQATTSAVSYLRSYTQLGMDVYHTICKGYFKRKHDVTCSTTWKLTKVIPFQVQIIDHMSLIILSLCRIASIVMNNFVSRT